MIHKGWYIPIAIVLAVGYAVGGLLPFGIHFLAWWPSIKDPMARFLVTLYGVGVLGAAMHCTYFLARDANKAMYSDKEKHPNFLDWMGYSFAIAGGGVTGILLYIAIRYGFIVAFSDSTATAMRLPVAILVAFCGGLATYKVRAVMEKFVEIWTSSSSKPPATPQSQPTPKPEDAANPQQPAA